MDRPTWQCSNCQRINEDNPELGTCWGCGQPKPQKTAPVEAVDHPNHYGGSGNPHEAIVVMEAWHGAEATRWFCILSAEKYLSRMGKKPGEPMARDLAKAVWYLQYAAKLSEKIEGSKGT